MSKPASQHSVCDGQLDLLAVIEEAENDSAPSAATAVDQAATDTVEQPTEPPADEAPVEAVGEPIADTDVSEQESAPASLAPASNAADPHALIVLADRVITPSGRKVLGALNSLTRLEQMLSWASEHLTPKGTSLQIWVVGPEVLQALGWAIDPSDKAFSKAKNDEQISEIARQMIDDLIATSVESHFSGEWSVQASGYRVHFKRTSSRSKQARHIDVILESYVQLLAARDNFGILGARDGETSLPEEDNDAAAIELGRRVAWWVEHIGTLPSITGANAGATLRDQIAKNRTTGTGNRARKAPAGSEPSPESPNPMPPLYGARDILEPELRWRRVPTADEIEAASTLQVIDQRAAYLASAGMLNLGYGQPAHVDAETAEEQLRTVKTTPFGLWHVELPAASALNLPAELPYPHPYMKDKSASDVWVTSVTLDALCAPVTDGGAGLAVDDLALSEAWIWPKQGRTLSTWAKTLREARAIAVSTGDGVMKKLVADVYKGYVGRMANPDMWSSDWMRHHHQPMWRSSIVAHARYRSRRAAMRIHAEHGLWPIRSVTDSWAYLVPADVTVGDTAPELGKLVEEKRITLTKAAKTKLAGASYDELAHVLGELLAEQ